MLELEHITAGYGDTVVLRDVTLSVPDSKVLALLGPNGAGKTTLVASGFGPHQAHERADHPQRGGRHREAAVLHVSPGHVQPPRGPGHLPLADGARQPDPPVAQGQGVRHH